MAITPPSLSGRNARYATRDWGAFLGPLTVYRLRDENELLSLLAQVLLLGRSDKSRQVKDHRGDNGLRPRPIIGVS